MGGNFTFQNNEDIKSTEARLGFCYKAYRMTQEEFTKMRRKSEDSSERRLTDKRFEEMFVAQHKDEEVDKHEEKNKNCNQFEYFENHQNAVIDIF